MLSTHAYVYLICFLCWFIELLTFNHLYINDEDVLCFDAFLFVSMYLCAFCMYLHVFSCINHAFMYNL